MSDTIQSAEKFADDLRGYPYSSCDPTTQRMRDIEKAKSRDAAHIALGREMERTARADEARKQADRYAACVEALRTARDQIESLALTFQGLGHMGSYERGLRCMADADNALADLEAPK
jgi:hypothetical protein